MEHPKNKLNKIKNLLKKTNDAVVQQKSIEKTPILEQEVERGIDPIKYVDETKPKMGRPKGSTNKNIGFRKKDKKEMERAAKVLWNRGIVHWKLDKAQMRMYNSYVNRNSDELVWVVTRQAIGKSFCAAVIAIEECLKTPNLRIAYISPQKSQTRDVVEKNINIIIEDCPDSLRPKYDTQRGVWKFQNGSITKVAGVDGGHIDSLRGQSFDIIMVDEAGFPSADEFDYAMKSVLFPMMTRADKPVLLLFSTPPKVYDHPFNDYWERAELNKNLVFMTIYDSCLPPSKIQEIEERYSDDKTAFDREYKCMRIADASTLVIPEATNDKMELIVQEPKVPPFFQAYVSADYGFLDLNAILFGYYDFKENKIVIQDELALPGKDFNTQQMAQAIKAKETELWNENQRINRYCDNNLQIINDFSTMYDLQFLATRKDNKQAAINNVRDKIQNNELIIDPKCINLINHIQNAVWDKKRKSFRRTMNHHYDFLDSLIYFVRNIDMISNPYPSNYGLKGDWTSPKYGKFKENNVFESFMSNIFSPKKNRIIK